MEGLSVIWVALLLGLCGSAWTQDDQSERITFYYFSQNNVEDPQMMVLNDPESINATFFDPNKPTMVLIHGFMESVNFTQLVDLRVIYIGNYDHNVISVNYDGYKPSDGDIYIYYQNVGQYVCQFLRYLMDDFNLKPSDVHMIAHSVGVHVAGEAGKCLKKDRLVRRITGLDPANWKDLGQTPMDIIRPADAQTVDCIHTSTTFGIHMPVCKCNYYAAGGRKQPECQNANEIGQMIGLCDHLSAFRYYMRSIERPQMYLAQKCKRVDANSVQDCEIDYTGFMGAKEDQFCDSLIYNVPSVTPA